MDRLLRRRRSPGRDDAAARRRRSWPAIVLRAFGLLLAVALAFSWWSFLRIVEHPSWPPPADAITPAGAQAITESFAARTDLRVGDIAIPYAPTTASDVQLFAEGNTFFPAILADIRAAHQSVHVMEFGFWPGEVGDQFVAALEDQARAGVAVRTLVDSNGSDPYDVASPMFRQLAAAGVQVVVHDVFPHDRDGLYPNAGTDWREDEIGKVDHRKMFVIDGTIGWIGGAGIE